MKTTDQEQALEVLKRWKNDKTLLNALFEFRHPNITGNNGRTVGFSETNIRIAKAFSGHFILVSDDDLLNRYELKGFVVTTDDNGLYFTVRFKSDTGYVALWAVV